MSDGRRRPMSVGLEMIRSDQVARCGYILSRSALSLVHVANSQAVVEDDRRTGETRPPSPFRIRAIFRSEHVARPRALGSHMCLVAIPCHRLEFVPRDPQMHRQTRHHAPCIRQSRDVPGRVRADGNANAIAFGRLPGHRFKRCRVSPSRRRVQGRAVRRGDRLNDGL